MAEPATLERPEPAAASALDAAAAQTVLERAFALYQQGQTAAALPQALQASAALPGRADAWTLLGILHKRSGDLDAALAAYRRATEIQPDYGDAWNNLGNLLKERGDREAALAAYRRAVELNPQAAEPAHNYAVGLEHFGDHDAALQWFGRTLALDARHQDGRWNHALALLLHGRLAEGFADYEVRFDRRQPEPRECPQPRWAGEPLQGRTVLIWAEQGFGDALQFLRFVPEVVRRGARVVLEVLESMMPLAAAIPGVAAVTPRGGTPPAFDCHVALMSLPHVLGLADAALPRLAPSVHVPAAHLPAWRERLLAQGWSPARELAVGWVWAGNPNVKNDQWRSPRLAPMLGLLDVPGVRWFVLQKGDGLRDLDGLPRPAHLVVLDEQIRDFADTAAAISQLDLVITSDTSVAHLAAALGKPTWVTLPWHRDWRYGMAEDRTAWYPSMRLFRQRQRGDWSDVAGAVAQALSALVTSRLQGPRELPALDEQAALVSAYAHYQHGRVALAREACQGVLIAHPQRPDAWALLGAIERRLGDEGCAAEAYQRAIDVGPGFADAWRNLGLLRKAQGRADEALALLDRALALAPQDATAHSQRSDVLRQLGRADAALAAADAALALTPHALEPVVHRANALVAQNRLAEAIDAYRAGLQHHPAALDLHYNLGIALQRADRAREALPNFDAVTQATDASHPMHGRALYSLGLALQTLGELQAAGSTYRRLLGHDAKHFAARYNLAAVYLALGQHERALAAYEHCLALRPDHVGVQLELVHLRQQLCDWQRLPDEAGLRQLVRDCAAPPAGIEPPSPFALLSLPVALTDADLAPAARAHAQHLLRRAQEAGPLPAPRRARPRQRLRLGYASADFHNHATMHLMRGVFAAHDRERHEVHAYSWGPDDGSRYRQQLMSDVEQFVDVAGASEAEIARRIAADQIDVLIDLKGYTRDSRPGIFVRRPAPLQLTWLGYPGSTGAPWFDAVLTDRIVTPPEVQDAYAEALAYLPHTYQCTDAAQPIARTGLTRAKCGLPDGVPVLACFCTHYKLDADTFAIWMRLLQASPQAVLWLIDGPDISRERLRSRARAAGIDPKRLVFAPVWPKERHLERLALADLFLDTRHYNGHTTVSDALWAGVPVVTARGCAFAGRVGASLLHAAGLHQGITESMPDYERLCLHLLRHPRELQAWRRQLAASRATSPLFDTARFVRKLEALIDELWQRRCSADAQM